jgi:sodium transport system permease protein
MRFSQVYRIVFRKEFRELRRDRRSLFWLFAPPIILPAIAICAGLFIGTQVIRIASDGFPILIQNGDQAPELVARFEAEEGIQVLELPAEGADPFAEAIMIVAIPEDFQIQISQNGTANIRLLTSDDSIISFFSRSAVRGVIEGYSNELLDQRLAQNGYSRDWLTPITIGERRVTASEASATVAGEGEALSEAEEEENGSILATIFLPLAVTSWLLGGGMGLVLDTTVGEKERQTIENLLVTPASRIGIVLGKMTVVFLASMAVMSLWLVEGMLLNALSAAGPDLADAQNLTPLGAIEIILNSGGGILNLIGALLLLIIPFTVMLNALVMSWCAYAANYREANLFMALVQLGLPASVLLTIFSLPPDVADWFYAIPFFGTIVAIRDLFSNALPIEGAILNAASGLLYASAAVYLAAWIFGKEWSLTRGLQ